MEYLPHEKINKNKWDECIANAFNGNPYAQSSYLDLVCPNWDAIVSRNYTTVFPLPKRKKYNLEYLSQPLFAPQLGVFTTLTSNKFSVDEYINAIPGKFKIVDLAFNPFNFIIDSGLGQYCKNHVCQKLYLNNTYNQIRLNYRKNHTRNIRKFEHQIPKYSIGELNPTAFYFYKLKSIQQSGNWMKAVDKNILNKLLLHFELRNKLKIICGFNLQNEPIGAVAFFLNDNHIFIQSFTTAAARNCGLIYYLIDKMIKEYAGNDLYLDFMGSSASGIKYRNTGFGSFETTFTRFTLNRLPKVISIFRK